MNAEKLLAFAAEIIRTTHSTSVDMQAWRDDWMQSYRQWLFEGTRCPAPGADRMEKAGGAETAVGCVAKQRPSDRGERPLSIRSGR